ncbi:GerW family sporulation protein [Xanthocytophaga agilis]|uniref:GerW family sporulation protein n=1 Tax=Xanthocytophaga agilis TaxID=3048010 RepID=A0AAE3RD77_9BACT|nr:GerW family sporulation protein [Xanthocytophaga agilis]MDJ1506457.1 GerW family sporulation protein [Xanthocytophaga agilis]
MNYNFEELLAKVTDFVKNEGKTETVVGSPFQLGDFTCVPVLRLGVGLGAGGGGEQVKAGKGEGGGAGVGMGIEPMGFLVTRADSIQFISAQHSKGMGAAFEKLPDILQAYFKKESSQKENAHASVQTES